MFDVSWFPFEDIPVWPTLLAITLVLICVDYLVTFSYFSRLGIPGPRPWPLVGHAFHFAAYGAVQTDLDWTQKYGKIYGHFRGRVPFLVAKDPDLLQSILIKDFASFRNRAVQQVGILTKKPLDEGLLVLQNDEWKGVRQLINPAFTSGKMKQMFPLVCQCATNLAEGFVQVAKSGENVLVKELFGAFSTDVIAGIGFGLDVNSIQDPQNIFIESARKMFNIKLGPLSFLAAMCPSFVKLYSLFGDGLWSRDFTKFFSQTILSTIKERKEDAEKRKRADVLQLMMNAKDEDSEQSDLTQTKSSPTTMKKKRLTLDQLMAQSVTFFFAGYETTSSTLQFLTYNLATNPECAEKLHSEIDDVLGQEELTYEALSKLVYLDQCLNETLRLHPAVHTTSRVANNDVKLGKYHIPRGTIIQLPYFGIHHDPETYPQPYKFDPERFSPSAKASRHPLMFSPFGQGPRFCIGMRLALLEAKVAMVHVMRKVRLVKCSETPAVLKFKAAPFLMTQEPIILQAKLIKK